MDASNVLMFYSTTFFRDVNGPSQGIPNNKAALWLSFGVGLANFLFTLPAYWWIDSKGRRFLLLATYPGMLFSMFGACLSFLGTSDNGKEARVGLFMFLFILFYSLGQGPGESFQNSNRVATTNQKLVAFAYASEVFPLYCREAGMSFAVFVNLFFAGEHTA
jgi:MFS family permease